MARNEIITRREFFAKLFTGSSAAAIACAIFYPEANAQTSVIRSDQFDGQRALYAPEINNGSSVYTRTPVGEGGDPQKARVVSVTFSWKDSSSSPNGFGDHKRAIVVFPRLGTQWQPNILNATTLSSWSWTGKEGEVVDWMKKTGIQSTQQSARDTSGNQPVPSEIGIFRLDYEAKALVVEVPSTNYNPGEVLQHLDLSYNDPNVGSGPVPLHVR